ncbi:hypothetical protein T06_7030 [Trichinella sp. T6]|nr:hypothetical protein T06_7030 [Trichinella sp. T6]
MENIAVLQLELIEIRERPDICSPFGSIKKVARCRCTRGYSAKWDLAK